MQVCACGCAGESPVLMLGAVPCRLMLYCALTGQLTDRSVDAIKKHMKGKKFQRAKGEPR